MVSVIDPYSISSVPIIMKFNGAPLSIGTAFVWKHQNDFCLITNWHNLSGRDPQTGDLLDTKTAAEPNQILVWFNSKAKLGQKVAITLPIRDTNDAPRWFTHPVHGNKVDVVALPITVEQSIEQYPINEMVGERLKLGIGMDIFILGYPYGIGPNALPIWKRASIATEPDVTSPDHLAMLVDTASRPGMSGSPVILRKWDSAQLENGDTQIGAGEYTRFVGVYSGRIIAKDPLDAQLGIVWPEKLLREIVAGKTVDAWRP